MMYDASLWLSPVLLASLTILFIVLKAIRSGGDITQTDVFSSIGQALLAVGGIGSGINLIIFGLGQQIILPDQAIQPAHPAVVSGFFCLGLGCWIVYDRLRQFYRKQG